MNKPFSLIVYAGFAETLADGESLQSDWIDCQYIDKIQFSGRSDTSGLTSNIESRADENQATLSTPVTYTDGPFYLFNIICRQRFMRFSWTNNTGSTVNDVSLELKATYGSSDKLSVFPVNISPSDFSQAALVQSILRGRTSDGTYVNVGVNNVGALNVSNFLLDVAREKYTNYRIDTKFGRNLDIDTGTHEDVWNGGGLYTGHNATANENLETLSSSASDTGSLVSSGTATGGSTTTLVDTGATFITDGVAVGDLIINDTQAVHGIVKTVTSETTLTVLRFTDSEIGTYSFASGDAYRVATATSTGAAVVKWSKILNEDYEVQTSKYVILNGVTGVTTTVDAMRCSRGKVILAGSTGHNVGQITLRQAVTTANIFAVMPADTGQTLICADTVPKGKTYIITNLDISIARASGTAGSANVQFKIRKYGESWQTKRSPSITTAIPYSPNINPDIIIEERSDVKWHVDSVSDNNTICSAEFEYIEIDNESV